MLRKILGWVCLLLGAFLLCTALLMKFVVPGYLVKVPLDVDQSTVLEGPAQKLNPKSGKLENITIRATNLTKIDKDTSDDENAAWVSTTCVVILKDDPPTCPDGKDPRVVQLSNDIFASDRVTGQAVNDPKYLGENPVPHEGLVNKFPFDTQKKDYELWDTTLEAATPAKYVGEETIDGLKTYKFDITIPTTKTEIQDGVEGTYKLDKTMWIEPKTGAPINMEFKDVRFLEDGTKVLDMDLAYTDEQVEKAVKDGKEQSGQLDQLSTVPPILIGVGLVLLLIGAILTFLGHRGRKRTKERDAEARRQDLIEKS